MTHNDALDAFHTSSIKDGADAFFRGQSNLGAINNLLALVGCMEFVSILQIDFADGALHEELACTFFAVVSSEVNPSNCAQAQSVLCLGGCEKMVCTALFAEFDAKIIHNEDKHDGAPFVSP